jgi:hypothetical protein
MRHVLSPLRRPAFFLGSIFLLLAFPSAVAAQNNCSAFAGTISVDVGPICLHQGQAILVGVPSNNAVVPPGFVNAYLLSRTNALIIDQIATTPSFTVNTVDVWRIHRLVYDPAGMDLGTVQLGSTSAYDLQAQLTQGGGSVCGSLSMTGAAVKTMECGPACTAFAAGMSIDSTTVCLQNNQATLTASVSGPSTIPPGFEQRFLLTRTNGLIIEQISSTPSFTVSTVDVWRIHNLVFDPSTLDLGLIQMGTTSAYDVQDLLLQGGGSICASLDISGAPVKTGECSEPCTAAAGLSSADQPDQCLTKGIAVLSATPDGSAVVPAGFSLAYLLSEASGAQTILEVGSVPGFTVTSAGAYRIHAFVYNPSTFPLSSIVPGVTTIAEVDMQLMQGEGGICASLDLVGAYFQVADCTPVCQVDAGTMSAGNSQPCLVDSSAVIAATSNGDDALADGYLLGYFLSQGPDYTLLVLSGVPVFMVHDTGMYHIHAFAYDPATFNSSMVQFGTTTAYGLNALLVQGGGAICAGFDLLGAPIQVVSCPPPCDAGQDTSITVCLTDDPFDLFGVLGGNPCPDGTWSNAADPEVDGNFDPATDPAGTYYYTVETNNGMDTAMVTVYVLECPDLLTGRLTGGGTEAGAATGNSTGIACPPDLSKQLDLRIWPNPANGSVHVELPFNSAHVFTLELTDAAGRTVLADCKPTTPKSVLLNAGMLTPGVWSIRVTDGSHMAVGRFVRMEP